MPLVHGDDLDLALGHGVLHRREIALRQREDDHRGCEIGEHRDRGLVSGMDDVAASTWRNPTCPLIGAVMMA